MEQEGHTTPRTWRCRPFLLSVIIVSSTQCHCGQPVPTPAAVGWWCQALANSKFLQTLRWQTLNYGQRSHRPENSSKAFIMFVVLSVVLQTNSSSIFQKLWCWAHWCQSVVRKCETDVGMASLLSLVQSLITAANHVPSAKPCQHQL